MRGDTWPLRRRAHAVSVQLSQLPRSSVKLSIASRGPATTRRCMHCGFQQRQAKNAADNRVQGLPGRSARNSSMCIVFFFSGTAKKNRQNFLAALKYFFCYCMYFGPINEEKHGNCWIFLTWISVKKNQFTVALLLFFFITIHFVSALNTSI